MDGRVRKLARKLDAKLANRLVAAGLGTPGRIRRAPDTEILKIEGVGPKALAEIREVLPRAEE